MAESSINLGDALAHDIPIEWYEAVAILQEVCSQTVLLGAQFGAPDPAHLLLHRSGVVQLLPDSVAAEPSVQRLGYALNALLQGSSPPAELRLFISQTTSAAVAGMSVDDFAGRLAYFERPDRRRILTLLFERAAAALAADATRVEPSAPDIPTAISERSIASKRDSKRPNPLRSRPVLSAVVVLIVCIVAFAGWQGFRRTDRSSVMIPAVLTRSSAAAGTLISDTVSKAQALLARTGLIDESKKAGAALADAPSDIKARPARVNGRLVGPSRVDPSLPDEPSVVPSSSPAVVEAEPSSERAAPLNREAATNSVSAGATVYTADDLGVVPPTLVWPQLPAMGTDEGRRAQSGGAADLLVNENGMVETVKLLTAPEGYHQRMLLSAMKAWRYHPAQNDGRPVKYMVRVKLPF